MSRGDDEAGMGSAGELSWIGVMPARYGLGGRHYLRLAVEPGEGGSGQLVLRYAPWTGAPGFSAWPQAQAQVHIQRRAKGRAAGNAQGKGRGQGVAEHGLKHHAADGQSAPGQKGRRRAGQAQPPEHDGFRAARVQQLQRRNDAEPPEGAAKQQHGADGDKQGYLFSFFHNAAL